MATETRNPLESVLHYHASTKHHLNAYARSLGYLDWATQPNPFRRFAGAPQFPLDHPPQTAEPCFDALFSAESVAPQPLHWRTISQLFHDSLALTAWKQAPGTAPWSLRSNPSSGDLHPTEGYLIAGPIQDLCAEAGIYHYAPYEHALEQRMTLTTEEWHTIAIQLPPGSILVGLASIYWRESWKYGERAFRYCHHDVGHAIGTVSLAAAILGWQTRLLESIADQDLAKLLCIHCQQGIEAEHPDCLLAVFPANTSVAPATARLQLPSALLERLANTTPTGTENPLSREHHAWPIIDEVAQATAFHGLPGRRKLAYGKKLPEAKIEMFSERRLSARRLVQQRRSAIAMDGRTRISREVFYHMLARVTPHLSPFPFQVLPWRPRIALVLFVHRINGLPPGLYLLAREASHRQALQAAMQQEFRWEKPAACPAGLELYLLEPGDAQQAAEIISCHQNIAAAGVFSLGMLAEFESSLIQQGSWFYPRLFWETGLIGQVLYLEAEAAGIRATGIGCFFDDALHQLLGIEGDSWQSLYHFTVGGPVEDTRLKTLHPYFHLGKERTY